MKKNENLFVTLTEECVELQQVVSEALRFGMDGWRLGSPDRNNEHDILVERYKLEAVMETLNGNVLYKFSAADKEPVKIQKKINVVDAKRFLRAQDI